MTAMPTTPDAKPETKAEEEGIVIRDHRKRPMAWIDTLDLETYGPELKALGIAVYIALAAHADGATQRAWPGKRRIASLIGTSPRHLKVAFGRLVKAGLLRIESRGRGRRTYYTLLASPAVRRVKASATAEVTLSSDCKKCYRRGHGVLPQGSHPVTAGVTEQQTIQQTIQQQRVAVTSLTESGLDRATAKKLAKAYPAERVAAVVAASERASTNRAGWIRAAGEGGWELSPMADERKVEQTADVEAITATLAAINRRYQDGGA